MAEMTIQGDELVLSLSGLEKAESLHGELRLPLSSISGIELLDDALAAVHGIRSPGTGIPGHTAVGTYRKAGSRTFAVVHHDTPRGLRVRLQGAQYDELVVGSQDPEGLAESIGGLR
ncbi:MAG: hypothetical protein ACYDGN_14470 [Acidimicrobiales bacterium]